jgi:hypothetical protein
MEWSAHKDRLRRSKGRETDAKKKRETELKKTSVKCERRRRKRITMCKADRDRIRRIAREAVAREKAFREEERTDYRWRRGREEHSRRHKKRYTKAESDSLAIHNIPAEFVDLFQELSHNYPVSLQPDHRAELFMEWVEEHPEQVRDYQAERFDVPDVEYARAYYEYAQANPADPAAAARAKVLELHQADIQDAHAKARKLQLTSEKAWDRYYDHTWPRNKTKKWAHDRALSAERKAREAWRKVEKLEGELPFYERQAAQQNPAPPAAPPEKLVTAVYDWWTLQESPAQARLVSQYLELDAADPDIDRDFWFGEQVIPDFKADPALLAVARSDYPDMYAEIVLP